MGQKDVNIFNVRINILANLEIFLQCYYLV